MTEELEQLHNLELLLALEVLRICEKHKLKIITFTFCKKVYYNRRKYK